ncbi:hypothetical protein ACFV0P_35580, partial [Streptomyces atroolivaceus]
MTRSSQQPPASPRPPAESASKGSTGSTGEETTVTAESGSTAAPSTRTVPPSEPAAARTGAEAGEAGAKTPPAGKKAEAAEAESPAGGSAEPANTGPDAEREPAAGGAAERGTGASPGARSESEPDPGAAAAAQSRLPALVRTMTATAIGRPQQEAGPVGRPGKAVLAGAAVAGALLVSVPFLVFAGNDDKDPEQPSVAAAGTVLDGSTQETPGEFAVTPPETRSPDADVKNTAKPDKPVKPVQ